MQPAIKLRSSTMLDELHACALISPRRWLVIGQDVTVFSAVRDRVIYVFCVF